MPIRTFSSQEFNRNPNKAKNAASQDTVFITDRGLVSYVLLSAEEYEKLTDKKKDIISLLAMDNKEDIDFDVPKIGNLFNPELFD